MTLSIRTLPMRPLKNNSSVMVAFISRRAGSLRSNLDSLKGRGDGGKVKETKQEEKHSREIIEIKVSKMKTSIGNAKA